MKPDAHYDDHQSAYLDGYLAASQDITSTENVRRDAIEDEALGKGFISGLALGVAFTLACFALTLIPRLF